MNFEFSEEQALLQRSIEALYAAEYRLEKRRSLSADNRGHNPLIWARYAEMGLLGLPFSEEYGGFSGGPIETMIVMQAIGARLALEPFLSTVVVAGGFLRKGGSRKQRDIHIPEIIAGNRIFAFACTEPDSRYDLFDVSTRAQRFGDTWRLNGKKVVVLHAGSADTIIVTARVKGDRRDRNGVGVFLVPTTSRGVRFSRYRSHDGRWAASVSLEGVEISSDNVIGDASNAITLIEDVVDDARFALCAEALGAMDKAFELTIDYLKTRQQFGRTIGSFQAIQHRCADMFIELEQARSITYMAAMASSYADLERRSATISAAKGRVGQAAQMIGSNAVQLHGAIGITMEHPIGHYFKRLTTIDMQFGDTEFHIRRVAQLGSHLI